MARIALAWAARRRARIVAVVALWAAAATASAAAFEQALLIARHYLPPHILDRMFVVGFALAVAYGLLRAGDELLSPRGEDHQEAGG